jgi:hypothetical protein
VTLKHTFDQVFIVDRYRIDADPDSDPDSTFHDDADPHPDPDPDPSLHMLENQKVFNFSSRQCQFTLFYLSRQRHRGKKFQYFRQCLEIFRKKNILALTLVKMDLDLDPDPGPADPTRKTMPFWSDQESQHCI